jgi:hypothetical protein
MSRSKLDESTVRRLYESGMTQAEIAVEIGATQPNVCYFMRSRGIKARVAAKRDQRGSKNSFWVGDAVKYKPAHNRVYAARGRPQKCEHCGVSGDKAQYEWANVSGNYPDPEDYIRLCISCHRRWDAKRRKEKQA